MYQGSHRRVAAVLLRPAVVRQLVLLTCAAVAALSCSAPPASQAMTGATGTSQIATAIRDDWAAGIDSLRVRVRALESSAQALAQEPTWAAVTHTQTAFTDARLAYKRIEFLTTYYEPSTARAMNGPALPDVEDEEGPEAVVAPEGFQVIEELLFPAPDSAGREQLLHEARNLLSYVTRLYTTASRQRISDDRVFDAAKLEIARIVSLGITGFDSPIALLSLSESEAALAGVQAALARYQSTLGPRHWSTLDSAFTHAVRLLEIATSFDEFDRLHFIASAANPLAKALATARSQLAIGEPVERRAFRVATVSLFDTAAFDASAFAAPQTLAATSEQVELGRALFFDPQLSGNGEVACASCHDPERAFTDGRARSASRSGTAALRNSPTMLNAGLQVGSFYDLRTTYLEDQVTDVVGNAEEMHGSVDAAATVLSSDTVYVRHFAAAFPGAATLRVGGAQIRSAVAAYVRSLVTLNSRVDRAFRGDTAAITSEERRGLNLFMGKAKCATCHFAPLFNGTVPPMYQESEVEVIGVPSTPRIRNARIDPDSGRFRVTRSAPHLHAFKTPSVRNAALTAPYMHNGVYRTLDEVVDFYNRGGGAGIGIELPNQTLPPDSLGLSKSEQRAIVRFMQALTDTVGVTQSAEARAYKARLSQRIALR
jgi:cytochrome c peroxidase